MRTSNDVILASLAAAILLCFAGPTSGEERLRITSWGGATQEAERKAYYIPFSEETGVEIFEDTWNGEFAKVKAMVDTDNVTWDVVVADYEHAIVGCDEDVLVRLDMSRFGDLDDFIPGSLHECGVPAIIFAVILGYNEEHVPEAWGTRRPKTIEDVFDTDAFPGKRALRKNPKWLFEQVLMGDGVPAEDVYEMLETPEGRQRVYAKLDEIKADVVWWESGSQPPQLLADAEVTLAQMYSSRLFSANMHEGRKFVPIWDGQVYSPNSLIVPKGANLKVAMDFLEFVTRPKVMARVSEYIPYGPARKSAMQYVPESMQASLPTAPANLVGALASGEQWWATYYEEISQEFHVWLAK